LFALTKTNGRVSLNCKMVQAESVTEAAFGCDWVRTPILIQHCMMCVIAAANKGFQMTEGKFVPVSNATMFNVRSKVKLPVTNNIENV